jgi:2-C-methyl-D-erythritol 4-phosphate cytidylyltransferase
MNYALILAGGQGVRMGNTKVPKQFAELFGKPMLAYSMRTAELNANIDAICVVSPPAAHNQVKKWGEQYGISKLQVIAKAGKERQKSVYNGLISLPAKRNDIVTIMTAVCPFVSQATIDMHFEKLSAYDACITVVKATDAISFSNDGKRVNRTLQKNKLFVQQGPQSFRYGILRSAHEFYIQDEQRIEVTEDSELVLNLGTEVCMVLGDRFCIKVTYPEDLAIAESLYGLFEKHEAGIMEAKQ